MAACEEARAEFAAKLRGFVGQRGFIGAGAKGDLLLMGEGVRIGAVTYAVEFKAVEGQSDFSSGTRTDFDARFCVGGKQIKNCVDAGLATREGCCQGEGVDEAPDLILIFARQTWSFRAG